MSRTGPARTRTRTKPTRTRTSTRTRIDSCKDEDLNLVLYASLRTKTRTRINITGVRHYKRTSTLYSIRLRQGIDISETRALLTPQQMALNIAAAASTSKPGDNCYNRTAHDLTERG